MRTPIYVVGRQHSGNTMLTAVISRHPRVHGFLNEDRFFEHVHALAPPFSADELDELSAILADAALPPLPADERDRIRKFLVREVTRAEQHVSAVALYGMAKDWIAGQEGAESWVQKATSYVFHAEDVLSAIPGARMVFMLRNPLDIATSLSIRKSSSLWLRMCMGWRKGVREAQRLAKERSDQFCIIRYEDLIQEPVATVGEVFRFCGLDFKEEFLLVDLINPAEKPFERSGERKGISADKLYYFCDYLASEDKSFLSYMADRDLILSHYPELAEHLETMSNGDVTSSLRYTIFGLVHIVQDLVQRAVDNPGVTVSRFWRRLRS